MPDNIATAAQAATGLTQIQLAAALGVSRRAVQYWCAGEAIPGPALLLCRIMAGHPSADWPETLVEAVEAGRAA